MFYFYTNVLPWLSIKVISVSLLDNEIYFQTAENNSLVKTDAGCSNCGATCINTMNN